MPLVFTCLTISRMAELSLDLLRIYLITIRIISWTTDEFKIKVSGEGTGAKAVTA